MTIQAQVSVQSQVFIPRDYQVFAGLDVDKHSIARFKERGQACDLRFQDSMAQLPSAALRIAESQA